MNSDCQPGGHYTLRRALHTHQRIKAHYLRAGRTEQQWQAVSADLCAFNRAWRALLRLPADDNPPPAALR